MTHYEVLAQSFGGKHGKTYLAGEFITDDQIYDGQIPELIKQGFIALIEELKPEHEELDTE